MKKFVSFIGALLLAVTLSFLLVGCGENSVSIQYGKNIPSTTNITYSRKTEQVIVKNTARRRAALRRRVELILSGERRPTIWCICLKPTENTTKTTLAAKQFLSPISRCLSARISLR